MAFKNLSGDDLFCPLHFYTYIEQPQKGDLSIFMSISNDAMLSSGIHPWPSTTTMPWPSMAWP